MAAPLPLSPARPTSQAPTLGLAIPLVPGTRRTWEGKAALGSHGKSIGKSWENQRKTIKSWENHRTNIEKWMKMVDFTKKPWLDFPKKLRFSDLCGLWTHIT
jgi:hypothetical protein